MFIFLLILFVCILLLPSCARADESPPRISDAR